MQLVILDNYEAMSAYAANLICDRINKFEQNKQKRFFVLGLPTGSTPLGTYKRLIQLNAERKVSFKNVITFNMDEYVGLPRDDPQSYHSFMFENFFQHIDIQPANVNILDGNATNLVSECDSYEKRIADAGRIDLFLGGIGENGHVAFNEPGSSLQSRTRVQALTNETIQANARFFGGNTAKVPTHALTVGVATVMDSNEVVILVNGSHKSRALQQAVEGSVSQMCTASAFQMHPNTRFVVDEAATNKLRVETVKHYKELSLLDRCSSVENDTQTIVEDEDAGTPPSSAS